MIKISEYYDNDASVDWFIKELGGPSIHQNLIAKGFNIIERNEIHKHWIDLKVPANSVKLVSGARVTSPLKKRNNAFLARYHFQLKKEKYNDQLLSDLTTRWMKILSGKSKFLISLNPAHYLFAVASDIDFTNVFDVARNWSIDCQIGVFDETEKVMFVFDPEFGLIYYSFDSACAPSNFDDFSSFFNTEVKSTFVSQGKERTGADKDRIRNYFDTVIAPAI